MLSTPTSPSPRQRPPNGWGPVSSALGGARRKPVSRNVSENRTSNWPLEMGLRLATCAEGEGEGERERVCVRVRVESERELAIGVHVAPPP